MEVVGDIAGGLVGGYLGGGSPLASEIGRQIGSRAARYLKSSRKMSNTTQVTPSGSRKRKPVSPPFTPTGRSYFMKQQSPWKIRSISRNSRSRADMRAYQRTRSVMAKSTESGTTMRAAKVINRRKKGVTFKKKRKVRISRKFKAKVAKALAPHQATGKYTEIGFQALTFPLSLGNQQQVARLGIDANTAQLGNNSQILFSPAMILNAASVMFNGKTATREAQYTLNGSLEYQFGTNSFDPRTSKITLKNSYAQFTLRNNTNRTWIIQLYEVQPKQKMNNPVENDCLQQWANAMINEAAVNASGPSTINLASATPNTLYANPMKNKMLTQKWNFERHEIILDPGQVYDHYVQGPSDTVYDYAKFWKIDSSGTANIFYDWQKGLTRQVFLVARLDLTNDIARDTARHGIADNDPKSGRMSVEYKNYYNILAPPHTGGTGNVAGSAFGALTATVTTERVRDCYFHKCWFADVDAADFRTSRETETDNT